MVGMDAQGNNPHEEINTFLINMLPPFFAANFDLARIWLKRL